MNRTGASMLSEMSQTQKDTLANMCAYVRRVWKLKGGFEREGGTLKENICHESQVESYWSKERDKQEVRGEMGGQ